MSCVASTMVVHKAFFWASIGLLELGMGLLPLVFTEGEEIHRQTRACSRQETVTVDGMTLCRFAPYLLLLAMTCVFFGNSVKGCAPSGPPLSCTLALSPGSSEAFPDQF